MTLRSELECTNTSQDTGNGKAPIVIPSKSSTRSSSCRAVTAAVVAVAFAILVSVAATHLHIGPGADEGCAVCAAFVGKLEGPSVPSIAVPPVSVSYFVRTLVLAPHLEAVALVVLPPSCGPPRFT